jgi:CheY-like chemotaxis protein
VRFDPLKILLVDDNDHMRLLLTEMLRAIGVRHIFEALDGMEALSMMSAQLSPIVGRETTIRHSPGNCGLQPLGEIEADVLQRRPVEAGLVVEQAVVELGGHTLQRGSRSPRSATQPTGSCAARARWPPP